MSSFNGGGLNRVNVASTVAKAAAHVADERGLTGPQVLLDDFIKGLPTMLAAVAVAGFIYVMTKNGIGGGGGGGLNSVTDSKITTAVEKPKTRFTDVAGVEEAKADMTEMVDILTNPKRYTATGARTPKGILLTGPPGTGKTLLARAFAGESNATFFSAKGSDFDQVFVGVGAARVRALFEAARKNQPAVIFIDEFESLGKKRGADTVGGDGGRDQTMTELLAQLDGFEENEQVTFIAATNFPEKLDDAIRRPGRIDRTVDVGLPDVKGRLAILKVHAKGKPLAADVNLENVAKTTIGMSGADLANICNEAALSAARGNRAQITHADFSDAEERVQAGAEMKSRKMNDFERRTVAYHEAGHAIVGHLTPGADPVRKIQIIPRGRALGVTISASDEDRYLQSQQELLGRLDVLYGGRAAEIIVNGEVLKTTGASDDFKRAAQVARAMVTEIGMSGLGEMSFPQPQSAYDANQNSPRTMARIDKEVEKLLGEAFERSKTLLEEYKPALEAVAQTLLEDEKIDREQFLQVFDEAVRAHSLPLKVASSSPPAIGGPTGLAA